MATLDMPDLPGPLIDMDGFTKAHPVSKPVTPLDVVFSCGVCHETFADIYEGCTTVEGLSDGINPKERLVTKLWLSACCHVYCGKHLEGGGPPFHPAGTRPRAPCPVCAKEKGEDRPRELYSIRGFKEGEYDSAIPACWFTTPPIKLDAAGKEMEALRFQYLSLIRFAQHVIEYNQDVKARLAQAQDDVQRLQKSSAQDRARLSTVEKENERLRAMEPELQKFKARMPAIEHYLKQVPRMVEQNEQLRTQLASFGCHVPPESYAYNSEPYPFDDNGNVIQGSVGHPTESSLKRTASSHTTGRSAANNEAATDANGTATSSPQARPMKRQKHDFGHAEQNIHTAPSREELRSRDLMPPPRGPLSKMKSMKRLWPGRKKSPNFALPPATADYHNNSADVQMYNDGQWEHAQKEPVDDHCYDRPFTRRSFHNGGSPYMSGGLSAGNLPYSTSPLHPSKSVDGGATQDPYATNGNGPPDRVGGLPSEPSYIRLMHNLSHDTGLNLGLKDPRVNPRVEEVVDLESDHVHSHQVRPLEVQDTRSIQRHEETRQPKFTFRPPNAPSSPAWRSYHPDPLRSNPPQAFAQRPVDRARLNPITPAPQRSQQPAEQAESVVSPFFKSSLSNSHTQHLSRAGIDQRAASSHRAGGYPSQRSSTLAHPDWHEPRSLNGLSFFNSPRNVRNEPILYDSGYGDSPSVQVQMEKRYVPKSIDSRGFITRPEPGNPMFRTGDVYLTPIPRSTYTQYPPQSATPRLSLPRPSNSRAGHLPSAMPSIISSRRSPVRSSRAQWNGLSSAGVRGGGLSQTQTYVSGNTYASPKNIFAGAVRRSVRR